MSCPNLALVHTSIEHSRDWCRRLLILGCQEPYAHQALHPVRWCGRLLKTTFSRLIESTNKRGFSYCRIWITNVVVDVYLADVISEMSILHFVV
ncbi:hypothetical protein ACOR70_004118, partial [Providencia stuartii]